MRNPALYQQLCSAFGEVRVANENEPLVVSFKMGIDGKRKPWKDLGGEEYRVCCPVCGDSRFRLYVNHAWGMDRVSKYPSSKLVVCQNEHCEKNNDRDADFRNNPRVYLEVKLKPYFRAAMSGMVKDIKPVTAAEKNKYAKPIPFPRDEWVTKLADLASDHPARTYVEGRKFHVEELGRYGVVYCNKYPVKANGKDYSWLGGRLFIPTPNGGWQARALEPNVKMKYFTCTGWKKSQAVYNIDIARQYEFAVVMEGVTDVWRLGDHGVCTFGKMVSKAQAEALGSTFNTVLLAFDTDAFDSGASSTGMRSLSTLRNYVKNVARVYLPGDKDPADCTRKTLCRFIKESADKAGIPIQLEA